MRVTVLDLPEQVAKAATNIEAAGLTGQIDTMGVDLSDDNLTFEQKYDAVFMIHMIREWSIPNVERFFKIIASILNPGGVILITTDGEHPIGEGYQNMSLYQSAMPLYFLTSASHEQIVKSPEELA